MFSAAGMKAKEEKCEANNMFDDTTGAKLQTLQEMERLSRIRTNFDQTAALEKFKSYLATDRRFDEYDHDALVKRVQHSLSHGAVIELDDPRLKGGEARPLERRWR
jgi:hypothetical protein